MKYAYEIVTDTAADIPWDALGHDKVTVVSMPMTLVGKSFDYNGMMHSADVCRYYRQLHQGASSMTAQVPPSAYRETFEKVLQRDHDVLYVGFSSGMSGSYHNAVGVASALNATYPLRRVLCVDSRLATIAQTMLLLGAIANRRQGMTLSENADTLLQARQSIRVCFIVEDMNFLLRGGRITKSQAFLGHALHIRPLLRIGETGSLVSVEKIRGANRALRELIDQTSVNCDNHDPLFFVGHCDAPESAASLVEALKRRYLNPSTRTFLVNPVIGCHTGPHMLALASCDQQLANQLRFILAGA